jgi:NADPH:quinone reductase-like Zn-dependent oxidoreductase
VIDPVWGAVAAAATRALAPGGRLVNYGSAAGMTAPLESAVIRSKSLSVLGYTNLSRSYDEICSAVGTLHGLAARTGSRCWWKRWISTRSAPHSRVPTPHPTAS